MVIKKNLFVVLILFIFVILTPSYVRSATMPYPKGSISIQFNLASILKAASGSDNWPVTWAVGGKQYTSWGDGGGFGSGYYDIGVAEVTGFNSGTNLWFNNTYGKSYGILGVNGMLWLWQCGEGSDAGAFKFQQLLKTTGTGTLGTNWAVTSTKFDSLNNASHKFFCPTFLQFGADYSGARDTYVYSYAPAIKNSSSWDVQKPGEIYLFRIPKTKLTQTSNPQVSDFEFFTGMSGSTPTWGAVGSKKPVFVDSDDGVMRTSVSYNAGLKRYFLITQHVKRFAPGAYFGIYDAPEPWGPWTTVLFADPWQGANDIMGNAGKTVFFNFSNKWASSDGKNFVMVYTEADKWASVQGTFITGPTPTLGTNTPTPTKPPSSPTPTNPPNTPTSGSVTGDANGDGKVDIKDYVFWVKNYNKNLNGPSNGDFNGSGKVDGLDYMIWLKSYTGSSSNTPTPTPKVR